MSDTVRESTTRSRREDQVAEFPNAARDFVVHVPTGTQQLFGVLTAPNENPNGAGALLLWGKGGAPSIGRNRVPVEFARMVADLGFHALRIDYRSVGESTGDELFYKLDRPDPSDAVGAVRWLQARGLDPLVLIGTCFGARLCLACASSVDRLAGVALLPPPLKEFEEERAATYSVGWHLRQSIRPSVLLRMNDRRRRQAYLRRMRGKVHQLTRRPGGPVTGQRWLEVNFLEPMEHLVRRRIPILIVNGRDDELRQRMDDPDETALRELLARAGDLLTFVEADGMVHGLATLEVQDQAQRALKAWLAELDLGSASRPAELGQSKGS